MELLLARSVGAVAGSLRAALLRQQHAQGACNVWKEMQRIKDTFTVIRPACPDYI